LDEPTTGLDPAQLAEIRSLLKTISAEKTVLFSTHIMQEVAELCEQCFFLNKGVLEKELAREEIQKGSAYLEKVFATFAI